MSKINLNKEELYKLSIIDIYNLVLEGKVIKTFPRGFWQRPDALNNAKKITKYLIEEKLKLTDDELKKQLSTKLFIDNKLGGMLYTCFNHSPFDCINLAFPNKFYPWEFKSVPNGYWTKDNVIKATKWFIEDKLKLSDEELKQRLSTKLFVDNGLKGMLNQYGNIGLFEVVNLVYPKKFHPWEFNCVSKGFWDNQENVINATRWLIEDKLKLTDEQLKKQLSFDLFIDNGLTGVLSYVKGSPYDAVNLAYMGKFHPWEFKSIPRGYWNKETGTQAVKWLIENKLKLTKNELLNIDKKAFIDNGLNRMLCVCFKGNYKDAIIEYIEYCS